MGPATLANPTVVIKSPITRPLFVTGKIVINIARALACIMAPPMPCIHLKMMAVMREVDVPTNIAAIVNIKNPDMYIGLRPAMSDKLPMGNIKEAVTSPYPIEIHCTSGMLASNSAAILGKASVKALWSRTDMDIPKAMVANTSHGLCFN